MSGTNGRRIKRRNLTFAQREKLRQNALKLIEEGKWGGSGPRPGETWGQRGRPRVPKHVPKPEQLVAVLEKVEEDRTHQAASEEMRRLFTKLPVTALALDRNDVTDLCSGALGTALTRGFVPRKAVVGKRGNVEFVERKRQRPIASTEKLVELFDPRPDDFANYRVEELLDAMVLLSDTHIYPTDESREVEAFLLAIVREVGERVDELLSNAGTEEGEKLQYTETTHAHG